MKNLIKSRGMVKVADVVANPRNWRTHPKFQQDVLREMLSTVGWVSGVIINERSGLLLDGHLRVMLAQKNGEVEIPAVFVDVTEKMALKILAFIDPLTGLSVQDADNLQALQKMVSKDQQFLRKLLADIQETQVASQPILGGGDKDGDVNISSTTLVMIGEFTFRLSHVDYYEWREGMYQEFGFNRKDVMTGIYERLGFHEVTTD